MRIRKIINAIILGALIPAAFSACMKQEAVTDGGDRQIIIRDVNDNGTADGANKYDAIESSTELRGETIGLHAQRTYNSSVFFTNAYATVASDNSATIYPPKYWPIDQQGTLKIFSWYPYNETSLSSGFASGAMTLGYTLDADAAKHLDVLADITTPARETGVNINFNHTLTKVTVSFKKGDPAPATLTISKIEFQNVGTKGTLTMSNLPSGATLHLKKKFEWTVSTKGTVTSTPASNNNTVGTGDFQQLGNTFLMLPADNFDASAKLVIYTNKGNYEFPMSTLVANKAHKWESGEYINYNVTYRNQEFQISVEPLEWWENRNNVIMDKQYYLKVSETTTQLAANATTVYIDVETNYKKSSEPNTGFDPGAYLASYIDKFIPGPTIPNGTTFTLDNGLGTAKMDEVYSEDGLYKYKITLTVPKYTGAVGTSRWAGYFISAGNMMHRMSVQQHAGENWLSAVVENDPSDPNTTAYGRKRIKLTSAAPGYWNWVVSELDDPYDIFLNKETIIGATGSGPTDYIYFYFKANAPSAKKATITFKNTNGSNTAYSVDIAAP